MEFRPLDIDWDVVVSNLVHVLVAYLLALPIGWNRERTGLGLGLRTFPLVALASCGYLLVMRQVAPGNVDAQSRALQGLLGGVGFLGGGAIFKEGGNVRGTATAASIWNSAAIGVAVAFNRFEIALVLSLVNFATLQFLTPSASASATTPPRPRPKVAAPQPRDPIRATIDGAPNQKGHADARLAR